MDWDYLYKVDYLLATQGKRWSGHIPVFETRKRAENFCDDQDISYDRISKRKEYKSY